MHLLTPMYMTFNLMINMDWPRSSAPINIETVLLYIDASRESNFCSKVVHNQDGRSLIELTDTLILCLNTRTNGSNRQNMV